MDNVIILAGGQGKRMKADMPKPMFTVLEEPMLEWVIKACEGAGLSRICVVKGFEAAQIDAYLNGRYETVLQEERLGTGHAVMQAIPFMQQEQTGNTLVLCGDAPFIDSDTIRNALEQHVQEGNAVTVITALAENPKGYGRILRGDNGITCIVEEKDATEEQRRIREINSGAYWFRTADLITLLGGLTQNNAQGEYYLTDTIYLALHSGKRAGAYLSENPAGYGAGADRKASGKRGGIHLYRRHHHYPGRGDRGRHGDPAGHHYPGKDEDRCQLHHRPQLPDRELRDQGRGAAQLCAGVSVRH